MADDLPRQFGPYRLLTLIARGGMGEVYLAKHGGLRGFEKHCVVKTLRAELDSDREYVERFSEEARVVVQLSHRNICSVFDVGRVDGRLYVAMEHIIGRDLRSTIAHARLPLAIAVHVTSEVLEALDYAHRFVDATTGHPLALVHRDVSPHNVLLGAEGDVKLIDFGIATTVRQGPLTAGGTVLGKLNYMAPEHARGDPVDGRADQFATAVMLVQLLTGATFYEGMSREAAWAISGKGGHRPAAFYTLDKDLRAILDRALEARPEQRYATCSEFGEALTSWARGCGAIADARDVRRFMRERYGDIASDARATYQAFASVESPTLEDFGPASQWETIATTMMMSPSTGGGSLEAPHTVQVRDRRRDATLPTATSMRKTPLAVAALVGILSILSLGAGVAITSFVLDATMRTKKTADEAGATSDVPAAARGLPPGSEPIAATPVTQQEGSLTEPTITPPVIEAPVRRVSPPSPPSPPPPTSSRPLGADTRAALKYLQTECVPKGVPCARNMIEWSKRKLSDAERLELADAVNDCVKTCKLR